MGGGFTFGVPNAEFLDFLGPGGPGLEASKQQLFCCSPYLASHLLHPLFPSLPPPQTLLLDPPCRLSSARSPSEASAPSVCPPPLSPLPKALCKPFPHAPCPLQALPSCPLTLQACLMCPLPSVSPPPLVLLGPPPSASPPAYLHTPPHGIAQASPITKAMRQLSIP